MAKKEERSFTYQKRAREDIKERANMRGGNFDSIIKPQYKQWKPKEGKNLIRILPPTWDDARHYGIDIFVNYSIGADNQAYLSLSKHNKGADPLAEARREAQQEGDKELAKALNWTQRVLYWLIDRTDEEAGPLLWASPFTFDKSLSNLCIDEDTKEVIFIDDPAKGRDVRFYREGTQLNTTYDASKMKILPPSSLHEDEGQEEEWLQFINDNPLPEVLNFYDYEHIKMVFDGHAGKKNEDEADRPSRSRPARDEDEDEEGPVRKGKTKLEEDDDTPARHRFTQTSDDDDQAPPKRNGRRTTDEDEDEDSAPRPRGRPRKSMPVDDEAVEKPARRTRAPVVEDEDDEDPPSTRRSSGEGNGSLRERLAARRRSPSTDDED